MLKEALLSELQEEGFNRDSVRALYLVPILDTAWADGEIQPEERHEILDLMEHRGIEKGSQAHSIIKKWLTKKPHDETWQKAKMAVEPLFEELKKDRHGDVDWVMNAAERVAQASGSKHNAISIEEKSVLQRISRRLKKL